jgi:hypothetical protein
MNLNFMTGATASSLTQNDGTENKHADLSAVFESILTEMMQEGNAQMSVTQVKVTATKLSNEDTAAFDYGSLKELCERLEYLLDLLFVRNGIPKDPPVEIEFSYTCTEIRITGDRDNIAELNKLINEDSNLMEQVKNTLTFANSVINMAESLRFQTEYRSSDEPEAIVDKYSYLFDESREKHKPSLIYGEGVSLLSDGNIYSL